MTVAFHQGLIKELILRLQQAGIRINERDANFALAGLLTREYDMRGVPIKSDENQRAIRSDAAKWIESAVADILREDHRFEIMKRWENDHPGESPFPDTFPDRVLKILRFTEDEELRERVDRVIEEAEQELTFW